MAVSLKHTEHFALAISLMGDEEDDTTVVAALAAVAPRVSIDLRPTVVVTRAEGAAPAPAEDVERLLSFTSTLSYG